MYIDIDRFKSFNDHYGYSRGDRAISFLAGVLVGCTQKYGTGRDFVGHVGGDDFVVATDAEGAEDLARRIIEEFDHGVGDLHDTADLERGFLEVENRSGKFTRFPLITVTVALIDNITHRFEHPAELSEHARRTKRYGKSTSRQRGGQGTAEYGQLLEPDHRRGHRNQPLLTGRCA